MSSIIEQAILDATQLREAALKTAENQIIEKYSSEIKEAMSSILDEDEEEMAVADIADEEGAMADEAPENVQQASMSVTKMCPCPDPEEGEESVFVFNLDDLQAANDGDEAEDAAETQGDLLDAVAGEIAEVLNLDEAAEEVEETKCNSKGDHSHSLEEEEVEVDDDEELVSRGMDGNEHDETGRNVALGTFRQIQGTIVDDFGELANDEDRELYHDYLKTNILLWRDKFEEVLSTNLPEPTTPEYEQEKAGGEEDLGGEEELTLEIIGI